MFVSPLHQKQQVSGKINNKWLQIADEVKEKRELFKRSFIEGETQNQNTIRSPRYSYGINSMNGVSSREKEQLQIEIKCKQWEVSIFKEKLMDLLETNFLYQKFLQDITESLQELVHQGQQHIFQDQNITLPEPAPSEEPTFDYINQMFEIAKRSISTAADKIKNNLGVVPKIQQLNQTLHQTSMRNLQLEKYINERKKYSEKLKIRVKDYKDSNISLKDENEELRSEIQRLKQQASSNQQYIDQLEQMPITLDIKFKKRDQLISMIKVLIFKMRKSQKDCTCNAITPLKINQLNNVDSLKKEGMAKKAPPKQQSPQKSQSIRKVGSLSTSKLKYLKKNLY